MSILKKLEKFLSLFWSGFWVDRPRTLPRSHHPIALRLLHVQRKLKNKKRIGGFDKLSHLLFHYTVPEPVEGTFSLLISVPEPVEGTF